MKFNVSLCMRLIFSITMVTAITLLGMYHPYIMKIKSAAIIVPTNLVPMDLRSMHELGLCPLFVKKEASMDPEIIEDTIQILRYENMSEAEIKERMNEMLFPGRVYHVFNDGAFQEKQVNVDVPCILPLGTFGDWNRTLIQLKSLDQGDLEKVTGLPDGLCAGHSLNNACTIRDYAQTGELRYLKYLNDMNASAEFLLSLGIKNWLNVQEVKENLLKMNFINIDSSDIFAISTAVLFDSDRDKNPDFEVFFDRNEFDTVQKHKAALIKGLQRDYYAQIIIIGNEEVTQFNGHFFMLAVIKSLNEIQYVVVDTFPGGIYHLQEGSHERNRLIFLIENIEQGSSIINLPNVRVLEYEKSIKELEAKGGIY